MTTTEIFISRPTKIPPKFETEYAAFERYLRSKGFRPNRLGGDQFTMDCPLKGVMGLMERCRGAIILGYPQYEFSASLSKAAVPQHQLSFVIPTPWNQIEGVLAFTKGIPVLVVAHEGVLGGIFDHGVTGEYVHTACLSRKDWFKGKDFIGLFEEWVRRIRQTASRQNRSAVSI